jgi:hypothetical protein
MQPQRELVEGESGTDAEQQRQHVEQYVLRCGGDQQQAADEHQRDAEDLMVDVHPADGDVLDRTGCLDSRCRPVPDEPGDPPGHGERAEHPDEHPERGTDVDEPAEQNALDQLLGQQPANAVGVETDVGQHDHRGVHRQTLLRPVGQVVAPTGC